MIPWKSQQKMLFIDIRHIYMEAMWKQKKKKQAQV